MSHRRVTRFASLVLLLVLPISIAQSNEEQDVVDAPVHMAQMRSAMKGNHVWMSHTEQLLILSFITPKTVMLEYGSGFSTLWYSKFVSSYYSIEHNKDWYADISPNITSVPQVRKYVLEPVDAKSYKGDGGMPQFRLYMEAVDGLGVKRFDAALVDGRARVDCAKYILKYLHPKSIVFIHDFWQRTNYHTILHYYDVVASIMESQSLVVLRPKPDALAEAVKVAAATAAGLRL